MSTEIISNQSISELSNMKRSSLFKYLENIEDEFETNTKYKYNKEKVFAMETYG